MSELLSSVVLLLVAAEPLIVAAASDLQPLGQLLSQYRPSRVRFVFGSSGVLARQVVAGAPFDVFLSADERRVRELESAGKVEAVVIYTEGRLAIWSKHYPADLAALVNPGIRHIAIANPQHAPFGLAAKEALERAGLWDRLKPKIVYGENVRQAFQFAESGNADSAIVSWTLVRDRGGKLIPKELYSPIRQAGGVVRGRPRIEEARKYLKWLTEGEGAAILKR